MCPACHYHGETIRGYKPVACWNCGAKLPKQKSKSHPKPILCTACFYRVTIHREECAKTRRTKCKSYMSDIPPHAMLTVSGADCD